jgi:prepilin-type N-terminal cleavage/methylation domain-containing protein
VNDAPQTTAATPREPEARHGFTLVELLVVIAIIASVAALAVPAVMQAIGTSKDAALKTEIDMLHMGLMNYRNEYGSFPPSRSDITNQNDPAVKHLRRLFVRCPNPAGQLGAVLSTNSVTPLNALGFWLSGFTGSPEFPLAVPGGARRPLYDFDRSRLDQSFKYRLPYSGDTPVLYIDSARYQEIDGQTINGTTIYVWRDDRRFNPIASPPPSLSTNPDQNVFHPDTFQIISAGRDGVFYTDDDISNMWTGTWRDWKGKQ